MSRVLQQDRVELAFDVPELLGVNHDFFGRPLHPREGLMDHDSGIGEGPSLAGGAGGKQHRTHRGGLPNAVGRHIAGDELHGVVDRQSGCHTATG